MKNKKTDIYKLIFAGITGILITITYILFRKDFPKDFIRIMPLYISLFIMFLQCNANRLAFLIGGINAVFYAVVYYFFGLYASALYALAISFPMQIITFFNWKKHAYGQSAKFKRLGAKKSIICVLLSALVFVISYFVLSALGSKHMLLDNIGTIFGTLVTVLCALRYIEYVSRYQPDNLQCALCCYGL